MRKKVTPRLLHQHFLITLAIVLLLSGCSRQASAVPLTAIRAAPSPTDVAKTPSATIPVELSLTAAPLATSTATIAPTTLLGPTTVTAGRPLITIEPSTTVTPTVVPGPTPDGTVRTLHVPILMYHYISSPPARADVYRRDLSVAPDRFESHLAYLRDAGYHTIALDDLLYALEQGRPLPEKPLVLTFDDGYIDNYTNAFPLLKKYGFMGHFFLITDFVNEGRTEYLTWPQIEEMAAAGQRFGSHSRNHPDLRGKSVDYLVWQALGGQEAIEAHVGYRPRWIAYPSGMYDDRTISVYKSANYWGGLTTEQGATHSSSHPFELSRVRVRGTYTADDLARLLKLNW